MPGFENTYQAPRVLDAVTLSTKHHGPARLSEVK